MWKVWTKFWRNKEEWRRIFSSARTHACIRATPRRAESNCRYRGCRSIDALVSIIRRPIVIGASYIKLGRNISRDIPLITDRILIGGGGGGREAELDSRRVILSKIHVKRDMPEINPRCVIVDFGLARSNT